MDRRGLLSGMGAAGLLACSRAPAEVEGAAAPELAPAAQPTFEPLDLSDLEAEHGGRLGFVFHAAHRGLGLEWRGDERFVYCSTFKMFLAAAVLKRAEAGQERLDRQVAVTEADMLNHAPVTEAAVGSTLSVERLCQAAVEVSDNPAANILMREIGGLEAMRIWYRSIGDRDTRVDRWEMELNVPDGDMDTIRPHQAVRNLDAVLLTDERAALGRANRERLTGWLVASPSGPNRIRAGTPAGWTVAHKTGTASGGVNDIGLLTTPDGEPFLAAAYFDGDTGAPVTRGEAAIAEAVRRAIEVFS